MEFRNLESLRFGAFVTELLKHFINCYSGQRHPPYKHGNLMFYLFCG